MTDSDLNRFLDENNIVTIWPKKQQNKELVVAYLATKFEFDKSYHESEINEILKSWHSFSDWPLLRRELFERGYFDRNRNGTNYRRLK